MMNDIIADSLTRIRNAAMRRLEHTTLQYAKIIVSILDVFMVNGFIESYKVHDTHGKQSIKVVLKYKENGKSVFSEIKRISKPGRRVYKGRNELKRFKNGYGLIVVSTSKGVISNKEAYRVNVGGEVLCSIW